MRDERGQRGGVRRNQYEHTLFTSTPSPGVCFVFSLYPNILAVRSFTEAKLMVMVVVEVRWVGEGTGIQTSQLRTRANGLGTQLSGNLDSSLQSA